MYWHWTAHSSDLPKVYSKDNNNEGYTDEEEERTKKLKIQSHFYLTPTTHPYR